MCSKFKSQRKLANLANIKIPEDLISAIASKSTNTAQDSEVAKTFNLGIISWLTYLK